MTAGGPRDGGADGRDPAPNRGPGDAHAGAGDAGAWGDHTTGERLHGLGDRVEQRFERLEAAAIEAELETGRREETVEEAKRHILWRIGRVTLGTIVLVAGLLMLALPGPGWLTILAGLVLLSEDVPFARRLVGKVRARLPQDEDGRLPTGAVVSMVAVAVVVMAGSLWFTVLR